MKANSRMITRNIKGITVMTAVIVSFLFTAISVVQAAELSVTIKSTAEVAGEKVFLKDIAEFHGPDCALKNDLQDVYITKSPGPGRTTNLRISYLTHRLNASGLPLNLVDWKVPEQVVIERKSQSVDEPWIRKTAKDYISDIEPYKSGAWKLVDVRTSSIPKLPQGEMTCRIIENASSNPEYLSLTIYFMVDGREAGKIRVTGKIDLSLDAVVAAVRMEKGHLIEPGDLQIAKVDYSLIKNGSFTEPETAYGMVCRRNLQAGDPLTKRHVEKPTVVSRGDIVTIAAQSGPLKVMSRGEVKRDGSVGDTIPVVNISSKKTVIATVVNANLVQVQF